MMTGLIQSNISKLLHNDFNILLNVFLVKRWK